MHPSNPGRIVILEKEQNSRDYLRSLVTGWGYIPFCFERETICLDNLSPLDPHVVITGAFPAQTVFRFLMTVRLIDGGLPVLVIAKDDRVADFVRLNELERVSVLSAHFEPTELKGVIDNAVSGPRDTGNEGRFPIIIGSSPEMIQLKKTAARVSRSKEMVLIRGEAGAGKELLARLIHAGSGRNDKPFVKIDGAALPVKQLEKELFGYTDRKSGKAGGLKPGLLEKAHTGTVFFREIAGLHPSVQGKLLQILEEGAILRLTRGERVPVDIRIIASTAMDLEYLVDRARFRKDLYYRLNVISLDVPPLRYRREDIPALTDFFADKWCLAYGKGCHTLSDRAKEMFSRYHWPGNVEELEASVKSAVLANDETAVVERVRKLGKTVDSRDFFNSFQDVYALAEIVDVQRYLKNQNDLSLKKICREFMVRAEKKLMIKALESTNWNRKKAAGILNISYKSMLNKIKAYDLA